MAEPMITEAVLSWPCCVHCPPGCASHHATKLNGNPHREPCPELVTYPGTGDPRPQRCQG